MSQSYINLDSDEKYRQKEAKWSNVMQRKEQNVNKRSNLIKNGLAKAFAKRKE